MPKTRNIILRAILGFFSLVFSVLSLPAVRNLIWDKAVTKGKEKIVDAEAKIVEEDKKQENKGFFG